MRLPVVSRGRRLLIVAIGALALAAVPATPPAAAGQPAAVESVVPGPAFTPEACPLPMPAGERGAVRCGSVRVPAHHDRPDGATVEVAVAVVPARRPSQRPPLLMLAGGPGEKLIRPGLAGMVGGLSADVPSGLLALATERDLVLVEQRGAGLSRPALECPEVLAAWRAVSPASSAGLAAPVTAGYAACGARLRAAGVDLTAFNTTEAARDIPAVSAALGYDSFDLFGTSYGARLALQVGRAPQSGLRRLVLASAIPAEADFVRDVGTSYDAALHELAAACAADTVCHAVLPDLVGSLDGVLRRLAERPEPTVTIDPSTGRVVTGTIDAFAFDSVVYGLFYSPGGPGAIPALIARAEAGDFSLLSTAAVPSGAQDGVSISLGQQVTFLCSEEAARPDGGAEPSGPSGPSAPSGPSGPSGMVRSFAARLFVEVHPVLGVNLAAVCAAWAVPPAPAGVFEPVVSAVPTLVVSGRFDQITPPSYGAAVAARLPAAVPVVVPAAGHSALVGAGRCGLGVVVDFVSRDDPGAVDTTCLAAPVSFPLLDRIAPSDPAPSDPTPTDLP